MIEGSLCAENKREREKRVAWLYISWRRHVYKKKRENNVLLDVKKNREKHHDNKVKEEGVNKWWLERILFHWFLVRGWNPGRKVILMQLSRTDVTTISYYSTLFCFKKGKNYHQGNKKWRGKKKKWKLLSYPTQTRAVDERTFFFCCCDPFAGRHPPSFHVLHIGYRSG